VRRVLAARGFSRRAAEAIIADQRASTLEVYDAKWAVFSQWCEKAGIDPLRCSIPQLADFFIFLFEEKNLAVSTIKGYRSAISKVYRLLDKPDPGVDITCLLSSGTFSYRGPDLSVWFQNGA
jgi:hypothetical protein